MSRGKIAISALALVLLAVGCGGDDEGKENSPATTPDAGASQNDAEQDSAGDEDAGTEKADASVDGGLEASIDLSEEDAPGLSQFAAALEERRKAIALRERDVMRREQLLAQLENTAIERVAEFGKLKQEIKSLLEQLEKKYQKEKEKYEEERKRRLGQKKELEKKREEQSKRLEAEQQQQMKQFAAARERRIAHFVETLKGMRASSAAGILASMDEPDAVEVLRQLGARKSAAILGAMPPDKGARLAGNMLGPKMPEKKLIPKFSAEKDPEPMKPIEEVEAEADRAYQGRDKGKLGKQGAESGEEQKKNQKKKKKKKKNLRVETKLNMLELQKVASVLGGDEGTKDKAGGSAQSASPNSFSALLHSMVNHPADGGRSSDGDQESTDQQDAEKNRAVLGLWKQVGGSSAGDEHFYPRDPKQAVDRREKVSDPSDGRHRGGATDGGCDNSDGNKQRADGSSTGEREEKAASLRGADNKGGDRENSNKNSELFSHESGSGSRGTGPVYSSFEQAGLPRHELTGLVRILHNATVAGQNQISVAIRTEELGEIGFHVRIEDKQVYIHAFAETEKAAGALALAIGELRDRLADVGLMLARLDVTTGKDRSPDGRPGARRKGNHQGDATDGKNRTRRKRLPTRGKNSGGVLHVLA